MKFILLALFATCSVALRSADTTAPAVAFFIVSTEPVSEGRHVDTPELPDVGYVSAPALSLSAVQSVEREDRPSRDIMIGADGKSTVMEGVKYCLTVELLPEDVSKFAALSERATGARVLIEVAGVPVLAPTIYGPIEMPSFEVSIGSAAARDKLFDQLLGVAVRKEAQPGG